MGAIVHEFCGRPGVVTGEGIHRVAAWGHEAKRQGLVRQERIGPAECLSFEAEPVVRICEDLRRDRPFAMYGLDAES